jgi:tetratricopeptide (TPR) repeat protein/SAM-dependent methyltransferase
MNRKDRRSVDRSNSAGVSTASGAPPGLSQGGPSGTGQAGSVAQWFAAARSHHRAGQLPQAETLYRRVLAIEPGHDDALHCLGMLAHQIGRSDAAAELMARAISINGRNPDYHYNLGLVLQALGRADDAAARFRQATVLKPGNADAFLSLGSVLIGQNRLDEAETACRRAVALAPQSADAHFNLAIALGRQHRYDDAIVHLRDVLRLRPGFAPAHGSLGTALMAKGELEPAAEHCRRALELDPRHHQTAVNLAMICYAQGDAARGLAAAMHALAIEESAQARYVFARCAGSAWASEDPRFAEWLRRALAEAWGRPSQLVSAALHIVKANASIAAATNRAMAQWPRPLDLEELCGTHGLSDLAADALLRELLRAAPVCDRDLERMLTALRRVLFDLAAQDASSVPMADDALELLCGLAQQCFVNEHVWVASAEEEGHARRLADRLSAALRAGDDVPAAWIPAVAAYLPLDSVSGAASLAERSWPPPVAAVVEQQVAERRAQRELADALPHLTGIDDSVSLAVKRQYEENPYPRWIAAGIAPPRSTLDALLAQKFPHAGFKPLGKSPIDVLIAGCGTGQHAIEVAQQYSGVDMLAVDLSAASLGYAAHKSRALGLTNIRYAVADILALDTLGMSFDFIGASGVLHHLADPLAAWRRLLSVLRPGGVMNIGLYSERGRADVVDARAFIAERGFAATADGIRRCRQEMMWRPDDPLLAKAWQRSDFFSLSGCRDLLFHAMEHRLTLPEIAAFLESNELKFLGFDADASVQRRYAARFPADVGRTDLSSWHQFEMENPGSFVGMYQFWIQKP